MLDGITQVVPFIGPDLRIVGTEFLVIRIRVLIRVHCIITTISAFSDLSDRRNDMRSADVDYVWIAPNTIVQSIELDVSSGQTDFQLSHSDGVVLGIVKGKITDLKAGVSAEQSEVTNGPPTLQVTSARSSKSRMVSAMFSPVCFFSRR
jgi:hypothetical protein